MTSSVLRQAAKSKKQAQARRRSVRGEAIRMEALRFGFFPQTFVWRGKRYEVSSVERCWSVGGGRWLWDKDRRYFRLRCADGVAEVYQDVKRNTWHIKKFERGE